MTEESSNMSGAEQAVETVEKTMERFFAVADVRNVYGRPVQQGDTTIIPAAEVFTATGFGVGYGGGQRMGVNESLDGSSSGGAGGGGGTSQARPVAIIVASPEGVRVEPVFDFTKIGLAMITAWGFMFSQVLKMRRKR